MPLLAWAQESRETGQGKAPETEAPPSIPAPPRSHITAPSFSASAHSSCRLEGTGLSGHTH